MYTYFLLFFFQEKIIPVLCSTSATSLTTLIRESNKALNVSPKASKIVMSTGMLVFF